MRDAQLGAVGMDFGVVPGDVAASEVALEEWCRLGETFKAEPTRFREGDRQSVSAYCVSLAVFSTSARALLAEGVTVAGRSAPDRGRVVKSPHLVAWTQASAQLQRWAKENCLTPDSRLRAGLIDGPTEDDDSGVFGGRSA